MDHIAEELQHQGRGLPPSSYREMLAYFCIAVEVSSFLVSPLIP